MPILDQMVLEQKVLFYFILFGCLNICKNAYFWTNYAWTKGEFNLIQFYFTLPYFVPLLYFIYR